MAGSVRFSGTADRSADNLTTVVQRLRKCSAARSVGEVRCVVVLSPSWPLLLEPHARTFPSVPTAAHGSASMRLAEPPAEQRQCAAADEDECAGVGHW